MNAYTLSVDYGTSNTVAVLRWPDGKTRPLLFDGSPMLPSAVYATPSGRLTTGYDAVHNARLDPTRFEPNPKRHIDELDILLGEHSLPMPAIVAATLFRVAHEARHVAGQPIDELVMTHPAEWGGARRQVLIEAVAATGLPVPRLVPEPVAAGTYFTAILGLSVPVGSSVVVYDLGAGTFDVSVVRRNAEGFETLAYQGLDIGGVDLDELVVQQVGAIVQIVAPEAWRRLRTPQDLPDQRAARTLRDDARMLKERLSRESSAALLAPIIDRDVHVTREELEGLSRPLIAQTIAVTAATIKAARTPREHLVGLFMVGGSTRMPLIATELHRATGIAPTVLDQPEMVVAEGALLVDQLVVRSPVATLTSPMPPHPSYTASLVAPTSPVAPFPAPQPSPAPPVSPIPSARTNRHTTLVREGAPGTHSGAAAPATSIFVSPPPNSNRRRHRLIAALSAAVLVLVVVTLVLANTAPPREPGSDDADRTTPPDSSAAPVAARSIGDSFRPTRAVNVATLDTDYAGEFALSPAGHILATTAAEGDRVKLWDVSNPAQPTLAATLTGNTEGAVAVAFSPTGQIVAVSSLDDKVRLWDVSDLAHPTVAATIPGLAVIRLAFSSNGRLLATGSSKETARLWDVTDRAHPTLVAAIVETTPPPGMIGVDVVVDQDVAFSTSGLTLATGNIVGSLKLWSLTDAAHPRLAGQIEGTVGFAFSPTGRALATSTNDGTGTVRLWDLTNPTRTVVATFGGRPRASESPSAGWRSARTA